MNKILLIILCFVVISCVNDPFQVDKKVLVSIDVKSYDTGVAGQEIYLTGYELTIQADKLTRIVSNDRYQNFEYVGDLVSKRLEYNLKDELTSDTRYQYDDLGRITRIVRNELGELPTTITNETRYENNQIISNWKNAWGYFTNFTSRYSLNAKNEVEKEESLLSDGTVFDTYRYTYSGVNLKDCFRKGKSDFLFDAEDTLSFEYTNTQRKVYYKKFMFGAQWRINSLIENSVNFFNVSSDFYLISVDPEISDNLIARYGTEKVKVNYTYTFDDLGDVRTEVREKVFPDGQKYKTVTTYTYAFTLR
jgi:hypothetical protein